MSTLPTQINEQLAAAGLSPDDVIRVVATALAEDLTGGADVTTEATIPDDTIGRPSW